MNLVVRTYDDENHDLDSNRFSIHLQVVHGSISESQNSKENDDEHSFEIPLPRAPKSRKPRNVHKPATCEATTDDLHGVYFNHLGGCDFYLFEARRKFRLNRT